MGLVIKRVGLVLVRDGEVGEAQTEDDVEGEGDETEDGKPKSKKALAALVRKKRDLDAQAEFGFLKMYVTFL